MTIWQLALGVFSLLGVGSIMIIRVLRFFRNELHDIEKLISLSKDANARFDIFLDESHGYFANYNIVSWKERFKEPYLEISEMQKSRILRCLGKKLEWSALDKFTKYFVEGEKERAIFNEIFVKNEIKKYTDFFNNIERRKLDKQQRVSIVTDEDNNIVIAGAGTGKTTTIVGKIKYIVERYKIPPDKILLVSFTKKAVLELSKRVNIDGITAKTFHKLGKDIIARASGTQPSVFDGAKFEHLLGEFLKQLFQDSNYLKNVITYFSAFMKIPKSQFDFKTRGEYIQYLKDQRFETYKRETKKAFHGEIVKSIEECLIANFLLFNGVNYKYEEKYPHDTANRKYGQYKPDFTIMQDGRTIYLEHFAISKNGDVPPFFADTFQTYKEAKQKYHDGIAWKRKLHKSKGTVLIETYSYEMKEGTLFSSLEQRLLEKRIVLKPLSPEDAWKIIEEGKNEITAFHTLLATFINLMKSNNYTIQDILEKNETIKDDFLKQRNLRFIELVSPILEMYEMHLKKEGEIDFSDMINRAARYINEGSVPLKYDYIIIDEFQDISIGRYQLIKSLKARNSKCKIFAVGDDWQSIYRFSGSDIALFRYFEKFFGFTEKTKIETTYRFKEPMISMSSEFIQKNPNQERKILKSLFPDKSTEYEIRYSDSQSQNSLSYDKVLEQIFLELSENEENTQKSIFILGRYSFDVGKLPTDIIERRDAGDSVMLFYENLTARFLTVHKSKGLEADIVIVVNCNAGRHGFPSEMVDDPVLNLLLSEADQFEDGEERRLFYVAMTRAREKVFFIAEKSRKSKFLLELEKRDGTMDQNRNRCPLCETGEIRVTHGIAKNGNKYHFYSCTNFRYGCPYDKKEWENKPYVSP